ncbi:enoyl-CoA hydratase/isomerase family protein [Ktedonosporobacter rubrisoli]|uniref:Enoyl-CoA hydratase/isomerase family protein n=1 Tax=Ktedonosporobacter rubrisoli TaxID=2509675 RepID=A0A4P6K3K4_KTERU|nr:enoyl-CoA hydratase/isomerase family protein [Ktedonosporobacter rubrisoli]QBD82493.1 enoyl-CoA hydratase/isomerase family protein [Ktedonosporobacter rubrisoli]
MGTYTHITVEHSFQDRIATVTLRRPEVHNAFNAEVVKDLTAAFTQLATEASLHGIILTGDGPSFSAGADINQMKASASFTQEQNLKDALYLADLLQTINVCPCPVIARVNGTAMGGGAGLVAVCDIAIASEKARFAFSEVKLGIAPAVISPYVIRKIGETNARVLFVTGERFSAARAQAMGLVHAVVPAEQLDDAVQKAVNELLSSAPKALRACKALALSVGAMNYESARQYTAETIAQLRIGAEGQEGLRAFLEKRKPAWVEPGE